MGYLLHPPPPYTPLFFATAGELFSFLSEKSEYFSLEGKKGFLTLIFQTDFSILDFFPPSAVSRNLLFFRIDDMDDLFPLFFLIPF